ncbi:DEAD-domain-containing protein [Patellaria atrata CBS 101060]|uniref:RNA helicase n=1 Tax=Patellaria atrata CBS 101060 TaxID=1346257 RepID=A0A9P4VJV1_9PEZI|nr:DEAD-domain-containing protein [Patellaria atrata CBS 101060]
MSKRTLDQAHGADHDSGVKESTPIHKKSRKDKFEKKKSKSSEQPTSSTTPTVANPTENNVVEKLKGRLNKLKDSEPLSTTTSLSPSPSDEYIAEDKPAKKLRKAERRARKEAKAITKATTTAEKKVEREVANGVDARDAKAVKAARKAEKAKLKSLAKAESTDVQNNGNIVVDLPESILNGTTTPRNTITSNITSVDQTSLAPTSLSYVEHPELSALPQSQIDNFFQTNFITIEDPLNAKHTYRPITQFSYLPIEDEAQQAPFASFTSPTPIQAAAWPSLLAGRDVIGVAETGSGKTLAFGVPCIRCIMSLPEKKRRKGVKAVIVSPTRELAVQIHEQLVKLATPAGLHVVCVYGGVSKDDQRIALRKASIVVATPGRLNDLLNDGSAKLSDASYVVLDEADRMLDKGFEDDIRKIISSTTPADRRQTLMFTATWPESVRQLASTFMTSPVKINIGDNPTGELRANNRIKQIVEVMQPYDKQNRLLELLKEHQSGKNKNDRILVFCLYKKEATRIENFIQSRRFRVAGIHGDLSQVQRSASLEAFKSGETPILVATDVAARGLDIPSVKVVINVTFPLTVEDYVHRIGRTGRAGKEGIAITLFTEHEKQHSGALINVLKAANQPVPDELLKFGTTVKKKQHDAYGAFYKESDGQQKATKITFD